MRSIYNYILVSKKFYSALKDLSFIHIYRHIKDWPKQDQLDAFTDFYHYLPSQGGANWLLGRALGIGGSEMSVLTDENQYKDMRNLIAGKVKLPEGAFNGSVATRWGNIFEPVLTLYVEFLLNVKIFETGSIPGVLKRPDGKPVQNYSPDGLAVAKKSDYGYVIDQTSQQYFNINDSSNKRFKELPEELILLFEFKNPYMRLPKGVVKRDYLAQPKAGMCTIPITDATLFVDGVLRKCSIRDFDLTSAYDTKFHCRKMRKVPYSSSIACGFIGIMDMSEPFERHVRGFKEDDWDVSDDEEDPHGAVGTEDIEYDEAPEGECVDIDIIRTIAKQIASYAIKEHRQKKSDYYQLKFVLENLSTTVRLLMSFLNNVSNSAIFNDVDFAFDDKLHVIKLAVRRLFVYQISKSKNELHKIAIPGEIAIVNRLLPDILEQLVYEEPVYDIEELDYGIDYGTTSIRTGVTAEDFEEFVEELVGNRHSDAGLKMYYPDKFFFDVESENASRLMKSGNYIDYTKNVKDSAQKWLFHEVSDFIEFCRKNNVRAKGILPWKLFEACCMPMYKQPDFIEKMAPKIRETVVIIDEIMAEPDMDKRLDILNTYYKPPRAKRTPVPRAKKVIEADPISKNYNQETVDFFEDLSD
jgi:hypothetical protein